MKTISIIKSIIITVLLSGYVNAAPSEWSIDPAHSGIYFDVKHIFSTVKGRFNDFSATVIIDKEKVSDSSVYFEVQVKSINTNIDQRDAHLRTGDFFDADKFPVMKFKSTSVTHVTGNNYLLKGDFTIKDVTKKIEIPFRYLGTKDNPMKPGKLVSGFECSFTINRLDYGVGDGKFYTQGLVGKDVDITISLELEKSK